MFHRHKNETLRYADSDAGELAYSRSLVHKTDLVLRDGHGTPIAHGNLSLFSNLPGVKRPNGFRNGGIHIDTRPLIHLQHFKGARNFLGPLAGSIAIARGGRGDPPWPCG